MLVRGDDPQREIEFPSFPLSVLGAELLRLGRFRPQESYLRALGLHIARCGFSVLYGGLVHKENQRGIEDADEIVSDGAEAVIY